MRKWMILLLCSWMLLLSLGGCGDDGGDDGDDFSEPPSNLEFWIAENVDDVDFSKYQMKYGMMGGDMYYGSGYVPTKGEDGEQIDPEHCVIYTVTAYPDYASKSRHVTYISITDPAITVFGLTVNSTAEEVRYQMEEKSGYTIEELGSGTLVARKGDFTFSFRQGEITIRVNVTNKTGMVF